MLIFKSGLADPFKAQAHNHIFCRKTLTESINRRRLPILPGPIDREILARIHHLPDLFNPLSEINHIMLFRYAYRGSIEFFHYSNFPSLFEQLR